MNKKIRKLIQRFRYLVYSLIAIIGVVLIIIALSLSKDRVDYYNILMGIGCSVIATSFVTIILLVLLPDDTETSDEEKVLQKWGLLCIHSERKNIQLSKKNLPKRQLDFIAFGLRHFRKANTEQELVKRIQNGLNIRIITLHPDSKYITDHQQFENGDGLKSDVVELLRWRDELTQKIGNRSKGTIDIKLYDTIPLNFYCQSDSKVYIGPYLPGETSNNVITYEFAADTQGGLYYSNIFDALWQGKKEVSFIDYNTPYLVGNQRSGVENVLRYFCDKMKGVGGKDVIGVVVMFKGELRRTIFSCNKPNKENNNCHGKDKGAVGELIKQNNLSNGEISLLFRDYDNNLTFIQTQNGREEYLKKKQLFFQKFRKDDMTAILAVPLFRDNTLIGAVTFDFSKLSKEYEDQVEKLKEIKSDENVDSDLLIRLWFSMGKSCAEMITYMLGNEIEIQYKKLFEEEWICND